MFNAVEPCWAHTYMSQMHLLTSQFQWDRRYGMWTITWPNRLDSQNNHNLASKGRERSHILCLLRYWYERDVAKKLYRNIKSKIAIVISSGRKNGIGCSDPVPGCGVLNLSACVWWSCKQTQDKIWSYELRTKLLVWAKCHHPMWGFPYRFAGFEYGLWGIGSSVNFVGYSYINIYIILFIQHSIA